MIKPISFSDVEVYPNWCCINFKLSDVRYQYIHTNDHKLNPADVNYFINYTSIVGFNFINYDTAMFLMMLNGETTEHIHKASFDIINDYKRPWQIIQENDLNPKLLDVIDIMPILKGQAGLKLYGARIHFPILQELPFDPMKPVTPNQQRVLLGYCDNDCDVTENLFNVIKPEIELRVQMSKDYNMDLRSKSGAGIAAAVLGHEYERLTTKMPMVPKIGFDIPLEMKYQKPNWIQFKTPKYQAILDDIVADTFKLNPDTGHLILGDSVAEKIIQLADRSVKMGIGGLHSIDGPGYYECDADHCIVDFDVASHYPSMILNSGWYPKHLGPEFLDVYRQIVTCRLQAKKEGNKSVAESLKLVINSSFGLFSMKYSILYDPNLLLNVTLSGQLSLLMLAERLELMGYYVISANTDGLVLNPKRNEMGAIQSIVQLFEQDTALTMEATYYSKYVRRDVNNYFTLYEGSDGMKAKGIFLSDYQDVEHNPTSNIVVDAVIQHFKTNIDVEDYIAASTDIRDFLTVRTVKGSAVKDGQHIGKVVRWYYSTTTQTAINYETTGNMVPKSQGGSPLMNLPDQLPQDLNYEPYIKEAEELLALVNVPCKTGRNKTMVLYAAMGLNLVPWPWKGVTIVKPGFDFSAIEAVAIQTGHRANTIAIKRVEPSTLVMGEWSFYQFNDKRYPGALKTVAKKLGFEIAYGQAIELTHTVVGEMQPLPDILKTAIFDNLGLAQRRKVVDGMEFLL